MKDIFAESLGQIDRNEMNKELDELGVSSQSKELIFQLFWRDDPFRSIISYRPYFDLLIDFLKDGDVNRSFSRPDFYFFVTQKLDIVNPSLILFAVAMETAETNAISEEELEKLLKNSKLSKQSLGIDDLIRTQILVRGQDPSSDKEEITVRFYHHSLQEYLAAKYILENDNPLAYLKKLVYIKSDEFIAIRPSWYNTIRFLIEIETSSGDQCPITEWLLGLGEKHKQDIVTEQYANALSSIIITLKTSQNLRHRIFDLIFYTYRSRLLWLPIWTRDPLSRIITDEQINSLENQISQTHWENDKERYVYLGYVAGMISDILKNNPERLKEKRSFWRQQLIKFANDLNENGVLQRFALDGLAYYKTANEQENVDLIKQVINAYRHNDELVKQAFIEFASDVAPNSKITIDTIADGMRNKMLSIYGRHGLYKIDNLQGIKTFLDKLTQDQKFLDYFLDQESIFNDKGKESDKVLIKQIDTHATALLPILKKVITSSFALENYYYHERSYFLSSVLLIIAKQDKNYFDEILSEICDSADSGKKARKLYDYAGLLGKIVRKDNVDSLFAKLADSPNRAESIIYNAKRERGNEGLEVFEYAKQKRHIKESSPAEYVDFEKERDEKIIKEFRFKLEPEKGQYMTDVFRFYIENKEVLEDLETDKQRLITLLRNSGLIINPRDFVVSKKNKRDNTYTITQGAQIYGSVLRAAQDLIPEELAKHRQNVIDFIPYAYSDDQSTIYELVPDLRDEELKHVNKIMSDKDNDTRYLIPSGYIYLVDRYAKKGNLIRSAIPVLLSFINDGDMEEYCKRTAVESLSQIISNEDRDIEAFFKEYIGSNQDNSEYKKIVHNMTDVLTAVFHDQESIDARFEMIINNVGKAPPRKPLEAYTVTALEDEMSSMHLAAPLIALKDPRLLSDKYYFRLIDEGFRLLSSDKKGYSSYAFYLFNIAASAVMEMAVLGIEPLSRLKDYLKKYEDHPEYNWWSNKMDRVQQIFVNNFPKQKRRENG